MHSNTLKVIGQVLSMHSIDPSIQKAVIVELGKLRHTRGEPTPEDAQWAVLIQTLKAERRAILANMHNRSEAIKGIYAEYLVIMDTVLTRMDIAQRNGTLPQAGAAAALVNKNRELEGKRPLGTNGKRWQTWVPPRIREDFANRVEQIYSAAGYKSGNRFVPFIPPALRKEIKLREANLRKAISRIRALNEDFPGSGTGYTQCRALHLSAARMAEISLDKLVGGYKMGSHNPFDTPLPVNWLALLDAPMRGRLREAQANPAGVDPKGLGSFFSKPPENVAQDAAEADLLHVRKVAPYFEEFDAAERAASAGSLADIEFED